MADSSLQERQIAELRDRLRLISEVTRRFAEATTDYERLLSSVARRLPQFRCSAPLGGFSLWLESDLRCSEARLLEAAIERGASFDPGSLFRVSTQPGLALRLSFSAVPEAAIDEGVARIARALKRVSARARP